ncbi:MAG: hypothetical protein ABL984_05190 [Pyrinomonadaceae bacterium]
MNPNTLLTIASLLSITLFIFHLADDIVVGIEQGDVNDVVGGTLICVVWLCGTLLFRGRLAGCIITLLGGLLAAVVPYLHFSGKGVGGDFAKTPGAYFFICTLLAMAVTGTFSVILSAHGLWTLSRNTIRQKHDH